MTKRERNPERERLVKQIIAEYQPKSIMELQGVLKSILTPPSAITSAHKYCNLHRALVLRVAFY